jgi:hypothetical protein
MFSGVTQYNKMVSCAQVYMMLHACDVILSVYPGYTLSWQSIGLVFQRFDSHRGPWPGIFFKLTRGGYKLRVTSQASMLTC